jgi:hypothetical protein
MIAICIIYIVIYIYTSIRVYTKNTIVDPTQCTKGTHISKILSKLFTNSVRETLQKVFRFDQRCWIEEFRIG